MITLNNTMNVNSLLLLVMLIAGLWTVLARSILRAIIGLAITSAVITILMFRLSSPLAAVFELSVCTGLITAVFVSAISLTKPLSHQETLTVTRDRYKRYWGLPVIIILLSAAFLIFNKNFDFITMPKIDQADVRDILWHARQLDLLGQIVLMLAGAFGVVILFKEKNKDE